MFRPLFDLSPSEMSDRHEARKARREARETLDMLGGFLAQQVEEGVLPLESAQHLAGTFRRIQNAERRAAKGLSLTEDEIDLLG